MNRKNQWIFLAAMFLLTAAGFSWCNSRVEDVVSEQCRDAARSQIERAILTTHWTAMAAEMAEMIKLFVKQDAAVEFILPDATDATKDEFERSLQQAFVANSAWSANTKFVERDLPESHEHQYYQPVRAQKVCLTCHAPAPDTEAGKVRAVAEGDLIAIARVTTSDEFTKNRLHAVQAELLAAMAVVFCAIVGTFVLLSRASARLNGENPVNTPPDR
jgi:hypothetical protein